MALGANPNINVRLQVFFLQARTPINAPPIIANGAWHFSECFEESRRFAF